MVGGRGGGVWVGGGWGVGRQRESWGDLSDTTDVLRRCSRTPGISDG